MIRFVRKANPTQRKARKATPGHRAFALVRPPEATEPAAAEPAVATPEAPRLELVAEELPRLELVVEELPRLELVAEELPALEDLVAGVVRSDLGEEDGFDGHEEQFFNEPPMLDEHLACATEQLPLDSIAPTVTDSPESASASSEPDDVDRHALESRRKRLRSAVIVTLCGSAAILLLGVVRRPTHVVAQAKASSGPAYVSTSRPPLAPAAQPQSSAQRAPIVSASAPAVSDDSAAKSSARELVQRARALLQAGQIRAGVSVARQALAANATDAEPYILLAAGLQDLGDWAGAQRVFAECKAKAHHGSNADCSYFLSQKR